MADKHTYEVLRPLDGDRPYAIGDKRELTAAEARALGASVRKVEAAPSEPAADPEPAAKAEPAPRNKRVPTHRNKGAAPAAKPEDGR